MGRAGTISINFPLADSFDKDLRQRYLIEARNLMKYCADCWSPTETSFQMIFALQTGMTAVQYINKYGDKREKVKMKGLFEHD